MERPGALLFYKILERGYFSWPTAKEGVAHPTHAAITENKRLGDVLAYIREHQQEDDKPKVKSNSDKNGYVKRVGKPGRRTDFTNDPAVIARRMKALSRQEAAE